MLDSCATSSTETPASRARLIWKIRSGVGVRRATRRSSGLALEIGRPGCVAGASLADDRLTSDSPEDLRVALRTPTPERIFQIKRALLAGVSVDEVAQASGIDPWFLFQMEELLETERWFAALPPGETGAAELR